MAQHPVYAQLAAGPPPGYVPTGPTLPAADNTLVWLMAFVPLLSVLTALMSMLPDETGLILMGGTLVLMLVDESNLKKQGRNTAYLNGWWLLIPVWMFRRAKLVGGGKGYAITWVGTFLLSLILSFVVMAISSSTGDTSGATGDISSPPTAQQESTTSGTDIPPEEIAVVHQWANENASFASRLHGESAPQSSLAVFLAAKEAHGLGFAELTARHMDRHDNGTCGLDHSNDQYDRDYR